MTDKILTIESNQNIFDVVLQEYGKIDDLFAFIKKNNIDMSRPLRAGEMYKVDVINESNTTYKIVDYFNNINEKISTGENKPEGISYWVINEDFIIP